MDDHWFFGGVMPLVAFGIFFLTAVSQFVHLTTKQTLIVVFSVVLGFSSAVNYTLYAVRNFG